MVTEWEENEVITADKWNKLGVRAESEDRDGVTESNFATLSEGDVIRTRFLAGGLTIHLIEDSEAVSQDAEPPVGTIQMVLPNLPYRTIDPNYLAPRWMPCEGQSLHRYLYTDLFNIIGTTYGGSGNQFNLPDFRNRYLRQDEDDIGNTGGENSHTLTEDEIPAHTHTYGTYRINTGSSATTRRVPTSLTGEIAAMYNTGNDEPHENRPASIGVKYYIKISNNT